MPLRSLAGLTLILPISGCFPRCCWNLEVVLQITTVSFLNPQSAALARHPQERLSSEYTASLNLGTMLVPLGVAGQQSISDRS